MPLRKVCRRPESDHRLQQLHAVNEAASIDQQKTSFDPSGVSGLRVATPAETLQQQRYADAMVVSPGPALHANVSVATHTVIPESKQAETSNTNIAGNANAPTGAALVSNTALIPTLGGSETQPEA